MLSDRSSLRSSAAGKWPASSGPRWEVATGLFAAVLFAATAAPAALAADPNPLELMKKSDKQHRVKSEKTETRMILQKAGAEQQVRQLTSHVVLDDVKGDRMRVVFTGPANVKDTALLTLEDPKTGDDEQWLHLPAFHKTRRVGQSELGDRFVGSDIYFEDLQQREVEDYSYTLLKSEVIDGQDCWVIEAVPQDPKVKKESPYGKSHIWLRKDNLFILLARLFDTRNKPLKEIRVESVKKVSGQAWRADKTTFTDIQRNHRTVLVVDKREVDIDIAEALFSKHSMERSD